MHSMAADRDPSPEHGEPGMAQRPLIEGECPMDEDSESAWMAAA